VLDCRMKRTREDNRHAHASEYAKHNTFAALFASDGTKREEKQMAREAWKTPVQINENKMN